MSAIDQEYRELVADIQYLESLVNQNRDEFKRSLQVKLSNAISAENRVDLTLVALAEMSINSNFGAKINKPKILTNLYKYFSEKTKQDIF